MRCLDGSIARKTSRAFYYLSDASKRLMLFRSILRWRVAAMRLVKKLQKKLQLLPVKNTEVSKKIWHRIALRDAIDCWTIHRCFIEKPSTLKITSTPPLTSNSWPHGEMCWHEFRGKATRGRYHRSYRTKNRRTCRRESNTHHRHRSSSAGNKKLHYWFWKMTSLAKKPIRLPANRVSSSIKNMGQNGAPGHN